MKVIKALILVLMVSVLTSCQVDDQEDKLFLINQEDKQEYKEDLSDERLEGIIKERYKNEEFIDIVAIDISGNYKGSEIFTLSVKDKRTHFRIFKRVKDDIHLVWEKESFYNKNQTYNLESIAPNLLNGKNMLVISRYKNPGMYLNFFVLGHSDKTGEIEVLYDNEFEQNTPVRRGQIRVLEDRMEILNNGSIDHTLYISVNGMKKVKPAI